MEGCRHGHRRQVGGAVTAGPHMVQVGQGRDPAQMGDAARMDHGRPHEVDQPLLDQGLAVPDGGEDLADGQRRRGMLADGAEGGLVLGRDGVLQPEGTEGLEILAQPPGLDRRQPVVHVMQQVNVPAESLARGGEQLGHRLHVTFGRPDVLGRQVCVGGLVEHLVARHAVGALQARNARLQPDRAIAEVAIPESFGHRLLDVRSVGVAVDGDPVATGAAQQLIQGQSRDLRLDVPKGDVDGGDGRHPDRSAAPVGAAIEELPHVLDPVRVLADEEGDDVLLQIGHDGHLAPVQGGVAEAVCPVGGGDLQGDEVAARAGHDHPRIGDGRRRAGRARRNGGNGGEGAVDHRALNEQGSVRTHWSDPIKDITTKAA